MGTDENLFRLVPVARHGAQTTVRAPTNNSKLEDTINGQICFRFFSRLYGCVSKCRNKTMKTEFKVIAINPVLVNTEPHHTTPHHTTTYHTTLHHNTPHHTTPHHTTPHHTIPHHTIPYHTTPYHTIPYPLLLQESATGLSTSCVNY